MSFHGGGALWRSPAGIVGVVVVGCAVRRWLDLPLLGDVAEGATHFVVDPNWLGVAWKA